VLFIMADSEIITIPLCLPRAEATALAALVSRIGTEDFPHRELPPDVDRSEADVLWSGLLILQGALAGAGFRL
jgi:hypothetical protein